MSVIVIYGAGGHAREVAWILRREAAAGGGRSLACFIEDGGRRDGTLLDGIPVLSPASAADRFAGADMVVAVGAGRDREAMWARAEALGFRAATVVDPDVLRAPRVDIAEGVVVFPRVVLSTDVRLGRHAHVNLACTLSHDVSVGDYATLSPGVHVAGRVEIGRGVFVGVGVSIINGVEGRPLRIGDGAVIGAGACVTGDIPAGITALGVPARPRPTR